MIGMKMILEAAGFTRQEGFTYTKGLLEVTFSHSFGEYTARCGNAGVIGYAKTLTPEWIADIVEIERLEAASNGLGWEEQQILEEAQAKPVQKVKVYRQTAGGLKATMWADGVKSSAYVATCTRPNTLNETYRESLARSLGEELGCETALVLTAMEAI